MVTKCYQEKGPIINFIINFIINQEWMPNQKSSDTGNYEIQISS